MTWWRQEADRLRALPLPAVLQALGAAPDRHDKHKWHTAAGVLSVHGAKFINWNRGHGGGGAIDLVMQVQDLRFIEALEWLARHFAAGASPASTPAIRNSALQLASPHPAHLPRVRRYLSEQRRIAAATIESLVARGVLYADARANAVFVLLGKGNKPVGAELRGTTERQWHGLAPGSRKDLGFFSVAADPFLIACLRASTHRQAAPLVLCESAIDALSCSLLHPGHRCISTSGARPNPAWLATLAEQSSPVYCGFDADPTGDQMAAEMMALYPGVQRLRPALHDWNDVLRSRA